jgi:hypothetical protein
MTANIPETRPAPAPRRGRRLRIAGLVALLAGIISASLVLWLGSHSPDVEDDPAMAGFNRPQRRQMGQLYGKMGLAIEQLADSLKQPGTQAKIILGFSAVVALVCFYIAGLKEQVADHTDTAPPGAAR